MRVAAALLFCLLPAVAGATQAPPATASPPVTVYRCTDAAGKVSLQDAPCPRGQRQQERLMQRPQDVSRTPVSPPRRSDPAPSPSPPPRTVYLAPPQPLYECVTPDGTRYTSDDGRGNPRWVPLWTLGYRLPRPAAAGGSDPAAPAPSDPVGGHHHWPLLVGGGGTWVRDDCVMLPPQEACARLRDRRAELRTRFFNAQEKERDVLRREERALNARLDNDCGGH